MELRCSGCAASVTHEKPMVRKEEYLNIQEDPSQVGFSFFLPAFISSSAVWRRASPSPRTVRLLWWHSTLGCTYRARRLFRLDRIMHGINGWCKCCAAHHCLCLKPWSPSLSVISAALIALGRSCLLANTSRMESLNSSSLSMRCSSSRAVDYLQKDG